MMALVLEDGGRQPVKREQSPSDKQPIDRDNQISYPTEEEQTRSRHAQLVRKEAQTEHLQP